MSGQWLGVGSRRCFHTLLLALVGCLTLGVTHGHAGKWERYQRDAEFMGAKWYIVLYSRDLDSANRGFERAWKTIAEIDRHLSNYRPDSELNRLCRSAPHAEPVPVGPHLWRVMRAADGLSRQTSGAFDVTVGPLTKLWRRARVRKQLPDAERLVEARKLVGYQLVRYTETVQAIQLTFAKMQLDLGGIAKGYAVDQALAALRKEGITRALVNGGGDLAVGAAPPEATAWQVAVASVDPESPQEYLKLANGAVATSGDRWQSLEIGGKRYSHIVDPRSGMGTTHRTSASVVAPTCMQADAWASAISVLQPEKGIRLIESEPNIEAKLATIGNKNGPAVRQTPGFAAFKLAR